MIYLPVSNQYLVLEIGSGHNPHPRSDILLDRWLHSDIERQRERVKLDRPMLVADGNNMPFADNSFDFVLCNQVLEHTEDPEQFISQMQRVAKSGLIIVPQVLRERLFGWQYHRWFIDCKDNTLIFYPKKAEQQTQFTHFIHVLFAHNLNFRYFLRQKEKELNIYHYWKGKIKYKIENNSSDLIKRYDKLVGEFLQELEYKNRHSIGQYFYEKYLKLASHQNQLYYQITRSKWRWLKYRQILDYLKCVQCGSNDLKLLKSKLICEDCNRIYKNDNNIFIMLNRTEIKKGY